MTLKAKMFLYQQDFADVPADPNGNETIAFHGEIVTVFGFVREVDRIMPWKLPSIACQSQFWMVGKTIKLDERPNQARQKECQVLRTHSYVTDFAFILTSRCPASMREFQSHFMSTRKSKTWR